MMAWVFSFLSLYSNHGEIRIFPKFAHFNVLDQSINFIFFQFVNIRLTGGKVPHPADLFCTIYEVPPPGNVPPIYLHILCVTKMEERGCGPPSRRTAAIGQLKSQWIFFLFFLLFPLYCNTFCQSSGTLPLDASSCVQTSDWLATRLEGSERPIRLRRVEQIFDDFLRLCLFRGLNFTLGCNDNE